VFVCVFVCVYLCVCVFVCLCVFVCVLCVLVCVVFSGAVKPPESQWSKHFSIFSAEGPISFQTKSFWNSSTREHVNTSFSRNVCVCLGVCVCPFGVFGCLCFYVCVYISSGKKNDNMHK